MKKSIFLSLIICALAFTANAQKLSPKSTATLMMRDYETLHGMRLLPAETAAVETTKAIINFNSPEAIAEMEQMGVKILGRFDDCVTAELPFSIMRQVSELDGIDYVSIANDVKLLMDTARVECGVDYAHSNKLGELPRGYKGDGIVIGIIDTAVEYNHIAFRKADGRTMRLARVWNQNSTAGIPPTEFGYGTEYTTETQIRAAKTDNSSDYHGTHVMGMAAGGDMKNKYYGVAPEAEIVFVSFGQTDADIMNAVKYIFNYADEVDKPCVINMSLGMHLGPHDGNSTVDKFFDRVTGPGRILVGACGNEGSTKLHCSQVLTADNLSFKTMLGYAASNAKTSAIDIWGTKGTPIKVSLAVVDTMKGRIVKQSDPINCDDKEGYVVFNSETGAECVFTVVPNGISELNGKPNIYITSTVTSLAENRKLGIIVEGEEGDHIHLWNAYNSNYFVNASKAGWTDGDTDYTVGEIGGTARGVISVGSYDQRAWIIPWFDTQHIYDFGESLDIKSGRVSPFSSHGPTADGRMKPDVLAPGAFVVSAFNKICYDSAEEMIDRTIDETGEAFYYYLCLGTSMSSPFVCGSVALWLEANPDLTPDQIRHVLDKTSRHDVYIGDEVNNINGRGKIDTYAGLKYILQNDLTAVDRLKTDESSIQVWSERASSAIFCNTAAPAQVQVFNIAGMPVASQRVDAGLSTIDAAHMASGIYIVSVATDTATATFKIKL